MLAQLHCNRQLVDCGQNTEHQVAGTAWCHSLFAQWNLMPLLHRFIFLVTKDGPRRNIHIACGSLQSLQLSALRKFWHGILADWHHGLCSTTRGNAMHPTAFIAHHWQTEKANAGCCTSCSGTWLCPCQCCTCQLLNFYIFGWLCGCWTPHKCAMQCHCHWFHSLADQPMGHHCRLVPWLCL